MISNSTGSASPAILENTKKNPLTRNSIRYTSGNRITKKTTVAKAFNTTTAGPDMKFSAPFCTRLNSRPTNSTTTIIPLTTRDQDLAPTACSEGGNR